MTFFSTKESFSLASTHRNRVRVDLQPARDGSFTPGLSLSSSWPVISSSFSLLEI